MTREEAIHIVKTTKDWAELRLALEELVPELKESEDERIRKELMNFVAKVKDIAKSGRDSWAVRKEDVEMCERFLAYLEKQKDASKAIEAVERIDKYIDEHLANAHDMKDSNPDKKYYRGWDDALAKMSEILQDVYSGEKQKEQKPSTPEDIAAAYQMGLAKGRNEQKPAEWSKEDERNLYNTIEAIKYTFDVSEGSGGSRLIAWLKFHLRPQSHWKPSEQ